MPITADQLANLRNSVMGLEIPRSSLDRKIAIGIKGQPRSSWLTILVHESHVISIDTFQIENTENIEDQLDAAVAILATKEIWAAIGEGGTEVVIQKADARGFDVSGQLSYFIRHARSIVDLLAAFGLRFVACNP